MVVVWVAKLYNNIVTEYCCFRLLPEYTVLLTDYLTWNCVFLT